MLRPRAILRCLLSVCMLWLGCSPAHPLPNIILILGDDHGYHDFGFMGSPLVLTPQLDRLAQEGVVFTHGFTTSSTCKPSYRSLLTGLHPDQSDAKIAALRIRGTRRVERNEIVDFETLPQLLGKKGYASFQGGKYWEGDYRNAGFTHGMTGTLEPQDRANYGRTRLNAGGRSLELGRDTMDPLWDFLDAHRDRPFFVWFAPALPHTPHDAGPEYQKLYRGKGLSAPALDYYASITRFDDLVGQVLDYLEKHDLREKTLLVYLSDNGWEQDPYSAHSQIFHLKGKASMHELGFRTPMIFSWPSQIGSGERYHDLVSSVDVFSTLLDFVGIEPLPDRSRNSLYPLLIGGGHLSRKVVIGSVKALRPPLGEAGSGLYAFIRKEKAYFLRNERWHYIWYPERDDELYDVVGDPLEAKNLAAAHPDAVKKYRRQIQDWLKAQAVPYELLLESGES